MENVDWNQRYVDSDTPWDSGNPSEALREFLKEGLVPPTRALELGCGTGTNAIFLASNGFQVTAVDLSTEAIGRAREKAAAAGVSIDFRQADVTDLPNLGEAFSLVFDRGTYHCVRSINLVGFQKSLARVVAPGGYYLLLAGNAHEQSPPDKGPPRVRAAELCEEIESNSFELLRMERSHFHGVRIQGQEFTPLAWKALFRRKA